MLSCIQIKIFFDPHIISFFLYDTSFVNSITYMLSCCKTLNATRLISILTRFASHYLIALIIIAIWFTVKSDPLATMLKALVLKFRYWVNERRCIAFRNVLKLEHRRYPIFSASIIVRDTVIDSRKWGVNTRIGSLSDEIFLLRTPWKETVIS